MTLGVVVLAIVVSSFYLFWTVFLKSDAPLPVTTPSPSAAASGPAAVLSVGDHRTMELQLHIVHA